MIRTLTHVDDLQRAGKLLCIADEYIFGDLIGDSKHSEKIGTVVFRDDLDWLLSFERTLVAENEGQLQGILCYRSRKCRWDIDEVRTEAQKNGIKVTSEFERVNKEYFSPLAESEFPARSAEIMFLAVDSACRNRGIGQALIEYLAAMPEYEHLFLDVLAENHGAIKLYRGMGFRVCDEHAAYPLDKGMICLRMILDKELKQSCTET